MSKVAGGSKCNLVTGYTKGDDSHVNFGHHRYLAQTFTISADTVVWRFLAKAWASWSGYFWEYALYNTDGAGKPTGAPISTTSGSPMGEAIYSPGKWRRFDFDDFPKLPVGLYALVLSSPTTPTWQDKKWRCDETAPTYTLGKAWLSHNEGVDWEEIPGTDFMFQVWGWEPPPEPPPSPAISNWAPKTISKALVEDDYWIQVTTDIPVHLFMRWTLQEPWTHPTELFRRGISLPYATRWCFVAWEENEQLEEGDTLVHTFYKPNWPVCQTRWFYFVGTKQAEESPSASPIFYHHREPPPEKTEMKIFAEYACRSLQSSHGTWATCWNGINLQVLGSRLPPNYYLYADTHLNASYFIRRGLLFFYLPQLPEGATLLEAKLGIHVLSHTGTPHLLAITEGRQSEPVDTPDWLPQNDYNTVLGSFNIPDLVDDQINEIPLNATGLAWLTWAMTRSHQYESHDANANAYFNCYGNIWPGQQFVPDQDHQLTALRVRLRKTAGTPKTIYAYIYETDTEGKPTGPPLCSGETDGATLSTDTWGDWREIYLGTGCSVTKGVKYALILNSPASNASNRATWICSTVGMYISGQVVYSLDGGSTWLLDLPGYDELFIEYNHLLKAARRLALRTTYDTSNTPPGIGAPATVLFYHPQKGVDFAPYLLITYKPPL